MAAMGALPPGWTEGVADGRTYAHTHTPSDQAILCMRLLWRQTDSETERETERRERAQSALLCAESEIGLWSRRAGPYPSVSLCVCA